MLDVMENLSFFFEGNNEEFVELTIKYYGLCWVFHILCAIVSSKHVFNFHSYQFKRCKETNQEIPTTFADKMNWDYTTASIVYCAIIFYYYVRAISELTPLGLEGRWTVQTWYSTHGITFHLGSSLYETTCYVLAQKPFVFYLHHICTCICCISMLFWGRASYWCCLVGFVEGTNIPLGIVIAGPFKTTSFKDTIWYKINGVILWIMYATIRIPCIIILYWLHQDLQTYGIDSTTANNDNTSQKIAYVFENRFWNQVWVYYMTISALFLWILSCVWFKQITSGMLKALGLLQNSSKKESASTSTSTTKKVD